MINEPGGFQQFSAARETVQANLSRLRSVRKSNEHGKNMDVTILAWATLPLQGLSSGRNLVQHFI